VLLVDEGINAIDVETAALVFETLAAYARDHAVLLISHNLRTLLRADRIYLLDDGRVADAGDPAALLENDPRFRRLWRLQEPSLTPAAA
jgi:ABC-type multidrug transport system fused ATPase/permease subunit